MSYKTQYVHLPDDKLEHIIGDGQRTECGVPIPYNSPWTTDPEGTVCSKCRKADGKAEEAQAALDAQHEAEILASAPPVEAPAPTPDAGTTVNTKVAVNDAETGEAVVTKTATTKAKAKSGTAH